MNALKVPKGEAVYTPGKHLMCDFLDAIEKPPPGRIPRYTEKTFDWIVERGKLKEYQLFYYDFLATVCKLSLNPSWEQVAVLMHVYGYPKVLGEEWRRRSWAFLRVFVSKNQLLNPWERFCNDEERHLRDQFRHITFLADAFPCYMDASDYDGYKKRNLISTTVICGLDMVPLYYITGQHATAHDGTKMEEVNFPHYTWEGGFGDCHYSSNYHMHTPYSTTLCHIEILYLAELRAAGATAKQIADEKRYQRLGLSKGMAAHNAHMRKHRSTIERLFGRMWQHWNFYRGNQHSKEYNELGIGFTLSVEKFYIDPEHHAPKNPPTGKLCDCHFMRKSAAVLRGEKRDAIAVAKENGVEEIRAEGDDSELEDLRRRAREWAERAWEQEM